MGLGISVYLRNPSHINYQDWRPYHEPADIDRCTEFAIRDPNNRGTQIKVNYAGVWQTQKVKFINKAAAWELIGERTLRLYPNEAAECPHCEGVLDDDNPVDSSEDPIPGTISFRGLGVNRTVRLKDTRPKCPHCGGRFRVVLYFEPKVVKDYQPPKEDGV